MKPLSKEVDNSEDTESQTVKKSDKVDINALFDSEKSKPESFAQKNPQNEHPVEQYSVENEANREQRHAFLKRVRVTRGLFLITALLVSLFFLGIILTISGIIYLQSNDFDSKSVENILPDSSKIISDKVNINSTQSNKEVINLFVSVPESIQKLGNQLSDIDMKSTTTNTNEDSFEGELLEELAPDSETNGLINGLMKRMDKMQTNPNEYRLEDLRPNLREIGRFFRRIFNIPQVQSDYED